MPINHDRIRAAQLLCSNARPSQYSAGIKEGYQAVYATHDQITARDIAEAEARILYEPKSWRGPKAVYFRTTSGLYAVGQITPLDVLDEYGRGGVRLSHFLFFAEDAFLAVAHDPFRILDNFKFACDLEAVDGDKATGYIPPTCVEACEQCGESDATRLDDDFKQVLLHIARLVQSRVRSGEDHGGGRDGLFPIAVIGEVDAVRSALRSILRLLPVELKRQCYFDSLFAGGSWNRSPYLMFGLESGASPTFQIPTFTVPHGHFRTRGTLAPRSLWERWMQNLEPGSGAEAALMSSQVYSWGQWLETESSSPPDIEASIMKFLVGLDKEVVWGRVDRNLEQQCGPALAGELRNLTQAWCSQEPENLRQALTKGVPHKELLSWTRQICSRPTFRLRGRELEELSRWAGRFNDVALSRMIWRWQKDWKRLTDSLREADDAEFDSFAQWIIGTISPQVRWEIRTAGGTLTTGLAVSGEPASDVEEVVGTLLTVALPGVLTGDERRGRNDNSRLSVSQRFFGTRGQSDGPGVLLGSCNAQIVPRRWVSILQILISRSNGEI